VSVTNPGIPAEAHPLYETWVMLLNGYGYNWYREDNVRRADDLLIRSKASESLGRAAERLRDLESAYRKAHLPDPTREHPDQDPAHLAVARRFRAFQDRVRDLDTKLRGAAVPPDDKIWARYRNELGTLKALGACDVVLAGSANDLDRALAAIAPGSPLPAADEATLESRLADIARSLTERKQVLSL